MPLEPRPPAPPSPAARVGLVSSGLSALFLAFDGALKLAAPAPVLESFARLGYPPGLERALGLLELACLAAYLVPRRSLLGAVLLTGFLGGATASHLRVEDPWLTHTLFPAYVGALLWTGLWLRDGRVRALLPLDGARGARPRRAEEGGAATGTGRAA